tara:strand:- start:426 stop:971 length:546 start_codon:yes stop_codon:yes gene_type:complete
MANRAAAMRYARALFEVAEQENQLETVGREVCEFTALMTEYLVVEKSLLNPAIPVAKKIGIVQAITAKETTSKITTRFLNLLAERNRFGILHEIHKEYTERLLVRQGILRARITTVSPLSDERINDIAKKLSRTLGKEVTVDNDVNSLMLGGVVTQIGSMVWDGSVSQHLTRLRKRFLGEV